MVAKKIKPSAKRASLKLDKPKEPAKPTPVVTQMVVEVEDDGKTPPLETIEKDTQAVEEAAQKLEEDIDKELETQEAAKPSVSAAKEETPQSPADETEEKRKAVVKEFFKSESAVAPEIATYKGGGGGKPLLVWAVIILVVAGLTGGGLMLATGRLRKLPAILVRPTPTPTPAPTLTPTPTPSVNRSDLKVQVLNGSGVSGAGSKMKDLLTGKGYTVADVGNADNFNYQNTEILVKPDKAAYLSLLQSDLKDSYTLGTTAATLSSDVSFDARVIVGQQ